MLLIWLLTNQLVLQCCACYALAGHLGVTMNHHSYLLSLVQLRLGGRRTTCLCWIIDAFQHRLGACGDSLALPSRQMYFQRVALNTALDGIKQGQNCLPVLLFCLAVVNITTQHLARASILKSANMRHTHADRATEDRPTSERGCCSCYQGETRIHGEISLCCCCMPWCQHQVMWQVMLSLIKYWQ